jgi:ATP-binding cassette, subfamily F, member 3
MGGYFLSNRQDIEVEDLDPPINLPFPDPEPMRFPGALCSATGVSFAYNKNSPNTLEDVTLTVHPGGRLGLIGKNGEGKSTLMKLLIGQLKPTKGKIERHPRLRFGYVFYIHLLRYCIE